MGLTYEDALGERKQLFVAKESAAGTFKRPAATDALAMLTSNFDAKIARKHRRDAYQGSRDTMERITGKSEYGWSLDGYYVPSGTKNVAPEVGALLEAILGTETVNADDVTYTQSSSQALPTVSLTENTGGQSNWLMQAMWGCMVEAMTFNATGGDEPKIHFEGRGMGYEATGYGTLNGAMVATDQMIVQAAEDQMFGVNSVVAITSTGAITAFADATPEVTVSSANHKIDNGDTVVITGTTNYNGTYVVSGVVANTSFEITHSWDGDDATGTWTQVDASTNDLGYRVSVATSAPTFTIVAADDDGAVTPSALDDMAVTPHTPTWTDAGVPTTGIAGSCTWDGLPISALVTGFELTVKANNVYHDNIAFQQDLDDATPGFFDITGKVDVRIRKDLLVKILDRKGFASVALAVIVGGAALSGTRAVITLPYVELDFSPFAMPEAGVVTMSMPFVALGSSGNDALSWVHT